MDPQRTPRDTLHDRCSRCSAGVGHEVYRFSVTGPSGSWCFCGACMDDFRRDLRRAHRQAGELLEQWFRAGA